MNEPVTIGGCTLWHGDCLDVLRGMDEASVDSVVTDPPSGISFMGRAWDSDKGGRDHWIAWMSEVAAECLRVAKPGAHALVWSLPRTSHWTATAWEDAGWTVRDRVSHLFGTGFPKSADISKHIDKMAGAEREVIGVRPGVHSMGAMSRHEGWKRPWMDEPGAADRAMALTAPATAAAKQWQGWGTALKPAVEDWWLLRKPLAQSTVAAQVLATGTGALNIDGCRVATNGEVLGRFNNAKPAEHNVNDGHPSAKPLGRMQQEASWIDNSAGKGRWPANLCHDGSPEVLEAFAAQAEERGLGRADFVRSGRKFAGWSHSGDLSDRDAPAWVGEKGGNPARFFRALGFGEDELRFMYSAKASRAERAGSKHPTVKPLALMRWLCRLVTPPGGLVLDCFAGTGVTGEAALLEGFRAVLIEREAEYIADIKRRLGQARGDDAPLFADQDTAA